MMRTSSDQADQNLDIVERSAADLSRRVTAGKLRPSAIMEALLDRIERISPQIKTIVGLRDRDALVAEALAADKATRKGWLHGLPPAVKDPLSVAGIRSTESFAGLTSRFPERDSLLPAGHLIPLQARGFIPSPANRASAWVMVQRILRQLLVARPARTQE